MTNEEAAQRLRERIGTHMRLIGEHPYAGRWGVFVALEETMFGLRPVVELDGEVDGEYHKRVFVMKPGEWSQM